MCVCIYMYVYETDTGALRVSFHPTCWIGSFEWPEERTSSFLPSFFLLLLLLLLPSFLPCHPLSFETRGGLFALTSLPSLHLSSSVLRPAGTRHPVVRSSDCFYTMD